MTAAPDVVTVTPNPAIDWTPTVPNFQAATSLAAAGFRVAATGWLGAADAAPFEAFFAERGIADHFVRVPGETGVDVEIAGPTPPPAERALLMERVLGLAGPNRWMVMAGSLPPGVDPGFYCELATLVVGVGARVLLDTSGDPLRRALRSEPHVLKPNLQELEALVGRRLESRPAIVSAARELLRGEMELVVVSLAEVGAMFVTRDRAVAAAPPAVSVGGAAGAGDAMAAGIVAGRIRGLGLEETARLASAFALAALTGRPADDWVERIAVSGLP